MKATIKNVSPYLFAIRELEKALMETNTLELTLLNCNLTCDIVREMMEEIRAGYGAQIERLKQSLQNKYEIESE